MPNVIDIAPPPLTAGPQVLRLLAAEPAGAIVAALADGPLRSGRLKEALPAHSPRTVYRRLEELERLGVIARQRLHLSPPAIAYELTAPAGRDLLDLVEGPIGGWLRLQGGKSVPGQASFSLALLAEAWESQIFHSLSCDSRSLTELGEKTDLTHHQAGRRAKRLAAAGILDRSSGRDRITRYRLSDQGRLGAALIAAASRWEDEYISDPKAGSLDVDDCTALLAGALSIPRLPQFFGRVLGLTVEADPNADVEPRFAALWAEVAEAGRRSLRIRSRFGSGRLGSWLCLSLAGGPRRRQARRPAGWRRQGARRRSPDSPERSPTPTHLSRRCQKRPGDRSRRAIFGTA